MQQTYTSLRWLVLAGALLGLAPAARAQNVGIGTTAPTQTLDVNGSLRVRGLSGPDQRLPIVQPDGTLGVSQPISPVTVLASPLNLGNVAVTSPTGAAISGNYLYVTHNSPNELLVFDISNPTLPVAVPAGTVAGGTNLDLLTVHNGYVYVCDINASNVRVYSLLPGTTPAGSPTAPAFLGTFATANQPDGAVVIGDNLFVASYGTNTVQVFNLSGPGGSLTSPPLLGAFATQAGPGGLAASPDGRYLYVADYLANRLEAFDLQAGALTPTLTATLTTGTQPNALAVANNLLYLTNAASNTLYIYGLGTPATPSYQSSTPTGGRPYGFDVKGNYAYLTNTTSNQVRVLQLTQSNSLGFNSAGQLTSVPNSALGDNLGNGVATTNVNLNGNYLVGGTLTTPGTTGIGIDASGNVGVGTLVPSQKLDVRGNLRLGDNGGNVTGTGQTLEFVGPGVNTDPVGLYRINPAVDQSELRAVIGDANDGNDKFSVGNTSASTEGTLAAGTFTPRFTVRGDGRVGVGTTTPRGKLDVDGPGDTYLVDDPDNGSSQSVYLPGHLWLAPYSGATGAAFIQARVPNPTSASNLGLIFRTTSAGNLLNALTIEGSGSISVANNLSMPGTLTMNSGDADKIFLTNQGANGSKIGHGTGWGVLNYAGPGNNAADGYHTWLTTVGNAYVERMRLNTNGDLGLGTTAPAVRLHVAGTAGTANVRLESLGGTGSRMVVADASGNLDTQALPTAPTAADFIQNQTTAAQPGGFSVSGSGTVAGGLSVSSGATISGATTVTGATTITGNLNLNPSGGGVTNINVGGSGNVNLGGGGTISIGAGGPVVINAGGGSTTIGSGSGSTTIGGGTNSGAVSIGRAATTTTFPGTAGTANVRLGSLAGTGTRLVTADASGTLAPTTGGSLLNRLLSGQSGTATLGSGGASAGYNNYTVTFPTAFAAAPSQVICTVRTENGQSYGDVFSVTTKLITATKFELNVKRTDNTASWGQTLLLDWIAIP
ncbi:beta-propeller fold lactonase family protein [Hymenobacter sp. ASUV-10]|uniref:Beta-propeller fold lactonase family protein n=1 Tax=Hymenobacter aranciens TaxID=3063996 RepID=A0ABT9BJF5_9BACT|nr:beta-propeller fold lactonase family protein [Hymenobacter sp. ASUV-10]MDO7877809.1 beta-propeller fold lactonase family protein [Hymenobacter sp. ASUV-10]